MYVLKNMLKKNKFACLTFFLIQILQIHTGDSGNFFLLHISAKCHSPNKGKFLVSELEFLVLIYHF